jgi:hypothetical protein
MVLGTCPQVFHECSPMRIHTHTQSHLVPVLSTTPIDYNDDGGTVRATWYNMSNLDSTPGIRRLVLLTLVLGNHVGKLYSASTLVLFQSASCSWDEGSRASAQLTLNVP